MHLKVIVRNSGMPHLPQTKVQQLRPMVPVISRL